MLLASLAVYNLNFQRIASGDTQGASLLPFALWLDGSVRLDRFRDHVSEPRVLFWNEGHAYSSYPIALPLLIAPLYAPAALVVRAGAWDTPRILILAAVLEKLAASLIAAASVACFYYLVVRLASPRRALLVSLAYAFGTETWTVSSQALWQHGGGELAVIAALLFLLRWWEQPARRGALALAGLGCALAAAIRPTNLLLLAVMLGWLLAWRRKPGEVALFLAAPVAVGAALVRYNLGVFGSVSGGYGGMGFDGPFWGGLLGLLLSPGRGLLVYTPVALFALLGGVAWLRRRGWNGPPVFVVSALYSLGLIVVVSKWPVWWGGHCYGPRLLTDIAPCLMLLVLAALDGFGRQVWLRAGLAVALLASVCCQALGAFCYPHSRWDETPVAVGARPSRLWDWKDSPLTRSLAAGPRLGLDQAAARRIRSLLNPDPRRGPQP